MTTEETVKKIAEVTGSGVTVFTDAAAQPDTETKVSTAVTEGAQVAAHLVPAYAPIITIGAELEPVIYHLISALLHSLRKPKATKV